MTRQQARSQRWWWPIPALALGFCAAALALEGWIGGFDTVRSSSGAWILLHVERMLLAGGDYGAACCVGMNPSSFSNPLYPWLVARLAGWTGAAPAIVAHWISGGAVGLSAVALFALWRPLTDRCAALAAAAAALFPPFLALGSLARYDTTASALVLLCAWSAAAATQSRRALRWLLPGVLAGLAYNTREFMAGPALGAAGAAWLADALSTGRRIRGRRARRRRRLGSLAALSLGAAGAAFGLPAALGLHPLGGLDAVLEYSAPAGGQDLVKKSLAEVLYLKEMWGPLTAGLLGLLAAARSGWRRGDARAAVLWGMVLPFVAFFASARQSAVYYLLLHILLLSGTAGLIALLPWWPARALAGIAAAGWLAWLSDYAVPGLLGGPADQLFEPEAWAVEPAEARAAMARAHRLAGEEGALIVVTDFLENFDALAELYHGRPAASLFTLDDPAIGQLLQLYRGRPVYLLSAEQALHGAGTRGGQRGEPPDGLELVDQWVGRYLQTHLYRLDPEAFQPAGPVECWGRGHMPVRGACLQAAWLEGGRALLAERILEQRPADGLWLRIKQPCH